MSRSVNKWIGIGNCCAAPEVRYTSSGTALANVTVACNDSYKDKNTGQTVDKTEFVRVVFFGKLAEIAGQYLNKGSQIYVEGRLQTRKWQGQDGQDRYTTEVVVDQGGTFQMLGGNPQGNQQQGQQRSQQQAPRQQQNQQQRQAAPRTGQQPQGQQGVPQGNYDDYQSGGGFDDQDIPF